MKKILATMLALSMVLTLAACGSSNAAPAAASSSKAASTAAATEAPAAEAEAPAAEAEAPAAEAEAPAAEAEAPAAEAEAPAAEAEAPTERAIKVNSFLTESSPLTDGTKAIVENINNDVDGITATGYYNGNLYGFQETWEAVGNGSVELAYLAPAVMDAYSVLTPIFSVPTKGLPLEGPIVLSEKYNEFLAQCPELDEEFAKSGIKIVWIESLNGQAVSTKDRIIKSPDEIKGLTMEALGKTTCYYFENLGATTVTLDVGDYYTSLERGIIDSQFTSVGSVYNNQLSDMLKYNTIFGTEDGAPSGAGIATACMMYIANLDFWNSLTETQQQQLVEACHKGSDLALELDMASMVEAKEYWAETGHEVFYCWGEDLEPWIEAAEPVVQQWIDEATAAGYDGQKIWDTYQSVLNG